MATDQRAAPRVQCADQALLTLSSGAELPAQLVNISQGGLRVELGNGSPADGQPVEGLAQQVERVAFVLPVGDEDVEVNTACRAIHIQQADSGATLVGMEFLPDASSRGLEELNHYIAVCLSYIE